MQGGNAVAHIANRQLQAHLGGKLRALYQPVVEETLPDRFHDLLDALERQELQSRRPQVRPGRQEDIGPP
jgi:Anti-sigma factor NepR